MDEEISSAVSYALNKGFQIHPDALEILHKINVKELAQIIKDVVKEKTKVIKKEVKKYVPEEIQEDTIKPKIETPSSVTFKDADYVLKGRVTDKGGSEKFYLFYQKNLLVEIKMETI